MTKTIKLVQQENTRELVFYLDSFSVLNELFSTLPKYVDYIDVHTLYNGSDFVEKYIEVVDTYRKSMFVESGKSFVRGYLSFARFYTIDFVFYIVAYRYRRYGKEIVNYYEVSYELSGK